MVISQKNVHFISLDPENDSAYVISVPVVCEHSRPITVYCPYCEAQQ